MSQSRDTYQLVSIGFCWFWQNRTESNKLRNRTGPTWIQLVWLDWASIGRIWFIYIFLRLKHATYLLFILIKFFSFLTNLNYFSQCPFSYLFSLSLGGGMLVTYFFYFSFFLKMKEVEKERGIENRAVIVLDMLWYFSLVCIGEAHLQALLLELRLWSGPWWLPVR